MPITKIVYTFRDSSVPPRYHRSYTITVTENQAQVAVNSYSTQLNECSVLISMAQFQFALEIMNQSQIHLTSAPEPHKANVGGTIEYLKMFDHGTEIFNGNTHGGEKQDLLCGDIKAVRQYLKSLFPDFRNLLKK